MCASDGTAMCGEPRVAAECTYTERDHGDGSDTRRCSWPTSPITHDPDVAWQVNGLAAQSGIEPSGP